MSIEASLADKAAALKGKTKTKAKKVWLAPEPTDFANGFVLGFDQTFSKTGWCLLSVLHGHIVVIDKGYINESKPMPDLPKFVDILKRTEHMGIRIHEVVSRFHGEYKGEPFVVLHEAPILHGYRVEASLLGAREVQRATQDVLGRDAEMVENRIMLNLLVSPDDRMNGKPAITRATSRYVDTTKGWNEHNRDAFALGLTYLHKGA